MKLSFRFPEISSAVLLLFCLSSCRFFHMAPFTLLSFQPHEEEVLPSRDKEILLEFSNTPDRTSVEENFILQEQGIPVPGRYVWKDRIMTFVPKKPISPGSQYSLNLSTEAEDIWGNSLYENFHHPFRTSPDILRPSILKTIPEHGSQVLNPAQPFSVFFSEPVDKAGFFTAFSITPEVPGFLTLDAAGTTGTFTPGEEYLWQQDYIVEISGDLEDLSGNYITEAQSFRFRLGTETAPPEILYIGPASENFPLSPCTVVGVNKGWETFWDIKICFSEKLNPANIPGSISIDPMWDYSILFDNYNSPRILTLRGEEKFTYDQDYTILIDTSLTDSQGNHLREPELYCFTANGLKSEPPSIRGCTFLADPGTGLITEVSSFGTISLANYVPSGPHTEGFFDIYCVFAESREPDIASIMENISISASNYCADLRITGIETENLTGPPSVPPADSNNREQVIRVHIDITDTPGNSGIITLTIDEGLHDSAGNTMESPWSVVVIK